VLSQWLRLRYSGFENDDQALDGGWAAHEQATLASARAREQWTFSEAFEWLVSKGLAPIDDPHVSVWAGEDRSHGIRWLGRGASARFTDLRVDASRTVVEGPSGWIGKVIQLPPVPVDPAEVEPENAYIFPSLAPDGSERWLVGVLTVDGLESLALDGEALPLHDPRGRYDGPREPAWSLQGEVLTVLNMDPADQQEMPTTAHALRGMPHVVVDLRGNEGGSDEPAADWVRGFSAGVYTYQAASFKTPHGWLRYKEDPERVTDVPPYEGHLDILVDRYTCSSGEVFALVAAQVEGARLLGENTAGCLSDGNVTRLGTLPHSGINVAAGVSHHGATSRPSRESWGVFPDVWLDDADPVSMVRQLPR
jgi:hypothetical protein